MKRLIPTLPPHIAGSVENCGYVVAQLVAFGLSDLFVTASFSKKPEKFVGMQ